MSFIHSSWLLLLLPVSIMVCYSFLRSEKESNAWVNDYWFFQPSLYAKWSFVFFSLAIFLLFLSLADLRDRTKSIQTKAPLQRTAILLDVSLSMFAEDVRPNRLEKAIQIAKHFVRKASGHSISLMIFSDTHRQLVPFTQDVDLLGARLNALKGLDINRGGSSIKKAVQETLGYLTEKSGNWERPHGNIVVISDADETFPEFGLKIPESITIAYIAVGTAKGGRIPLRERSGKLRGYKRYRNEEVITRINEQELKKWESLVKNFSYWVVSSYSIPTEDMMSYFQRSHHLKFMESESLIRPVMMEYLVIPALIFFMFALLLRMAPKYQIGILLLFLSNIHGAEDKENGEASVQEDPLYQRFKSGKASKQERLKVAEQYLRADQSEKALHIYEENLSEEEIKDQQYWPSVVNHGTALMKNGQIKKGIDLLNDYKGSIDDKDVKKAINENILALLKQQQQQSQEEQQQKENSSGESNEGKSKEDNKNAAQKAPKPEESQPKVGQQESKKRKKGELPVLLKQLVDKDKKLQEKMLDTKTKEKSSSQQKDW